MAIAITLRIANFFFGNGSSENVDMQHAIFVCLIQLYCLFLSDFSSKMYLKKYRENNLCNTYCLCSILAILKLFFPLQHFKVKSDTRISPSGKCYIICKRYR